MGGDKRESLFKIGDMVIHEMSSGELDEESFGEEVYQLLVVEKVIPEEYVDTCWNCKYFDNCDAGIVPSLVANCKYADKSIKIKYKYLLNNGETICERDLCKCIIYKKKKGKNY